MKMKDLKNAILADKEAGRIPFVVIGTAGTTNHRKH